MTAARGLQTKRLVLVRWNESSKGQSLLVGEAIGAKLAFVENGDELSDVV